MANVLELSVSGLLSLAAKEESMVYVTVPNSEGETRGIVVAVTGEAAAELERQLEQQFEAADATPAPEPTTTGPVS